mmetsp:Transcript_3151/g.12649  ORF Transcript_3151/g.12649 Transcript_3151/m.12649 type:complete len:251 (+) Transcript_3151:2189-2941(+)
MHDTRRRERGGLTYARTTVVYQQISVLETHRYEGRALLNPRSSEKTLCVPETGPASRGFWFGFTSSMPCTGVNAKLDAMPFTDSAVPLPPLFAHLSCARLGTFILVCFAVMRSLPLAAAIPADVPSVPSPSPSSPYSSSAWLKLSRFAAFCMSLCPYRSFIARARFPPRRFFASPPGMGSGFAVRAGGNSCHFSIFASISARMALPALAAGSWPNASMRAMSAHFPATSRAARMRSAGGVLRWMMSHWKM